MNPLFIRLFVGPVHIVVDPVVVEPPVDSGRLDAADRQEAPAGPGSNPHGEQTWEK